MGKTAQAAPVQRNSAVDILKAVAIIGVLTIHVSAGGYNYDIGSFHWCSSLFWGCLARASVPIFLMCSGALLLDPQKQITLRTLYLKNLIRIIAAMLFWAMAYKIYGLLASGGACTIPWIIQSVKEIILFRHEFHLYYLHIMILVYVFLPVTRILTEKATKRQLQYFLALWFVLGIVYPTARSFWPFTLLSGVPLEWSMNMAYSAIGYGVMGFYMKTFAVWKPKVYLLIFAFGVACIFGGTLGMSISRETLYQLFLEGMSPGVAVMAFGLFGFVTVLRRDKGRCPAAEKLSKASFCIYLVHMFFLYTFTRLGFTVQILPTLISVPVLVCAVFACSFLVYLVLARIPVASKYLI